MTHQTTAKSWQRTDSTGQLHVFLVLRLKANDSLQIISRENLPPTLRCGRLSLNQKVIMRDEGRSSIEGVVVYIHPDRNQCVQYKTNMMKSKTSAECNQQSYEESIGHCSPEYGTFDAQNEQCDVSRQKNQSHVSNATRPTAPTFNVHHVNRPKNQSSSGNERINRLQPIADISFEMGDDLKCIDDSSTSVQRQPTFDDESVEGISAPITEDVNNDIYIDKIKNLSIKLQQQASIIKERDAEIKRLRTTTISIPTDPVIRDYLCHLADKIRHQSSAHKYTGNLSVDAKRLGIKVDQLNETLKLKNGITSIARDIFKKIVPEHYMTVENWNKLPEEILMKEKILIDFLDRYFGSLEVEPKKIHTSLVGCLRNNRGIMKKQQKLLESACDSERNDIATI